MKQKVIKIGSLTYGGGTVTVYHYLMENVNPYRIYVETYYKDDKHSYPTKHKKLVAKYANLASVTAAIHNSVMEYERNGWV